MRPLALALSMSVAFLTVPLGARQEDAVAQELANLQGVWIVVSAERDGQPLDRIKGNTLRIKDQGFVIKTATITLQGTLSIDPAPKIKTMDWRHEADLLKDKVWQAIYERKGDELRICYRDADSDQPRPRDFETSEGSGLQIVVLKKQKE